MEQTFCHVWLKTISAVILVLSVFTGPMAIAQSDEPGPLTTYTPKLSAEFKKLLQSADLDAGKEYFMRKCSSCHDEYWSDTHGKGPNLWNIFGRKAGTAKDFDYSDAMRTSGHIWTWETLNYYLTNTKRAVPGRRMNFRGIKKDKDRAKLLIFLRSMNDTPPPIPK